VLSEKLKQWIVDNTYKQNQGARPIIRTIEQKIEEEISNLLIEEDKILNSKQKELLADIDENDNVHFSVSKKCKSIVDVEPVSEKDAEKEAESNY
jgi:ATP-dependent Clp protease ATP-binding subunit ClpA